MTFSYDPQLSILKSALRNERSMSYRSLIRFSNGKSVLDDRDPDAHGMAIKIFGIEGKKALSGDESDVQDFILLDNEVFFASDAETLLGFMMAMAAAAQKNQDAIKAFVEKSEHNLTLRSF